MMIAIIADGEKRALILANQCSFFGLLERACYSPNV